MCFLQFLLHRLMERLTCVQIRERNTKKQPTFWIVWWVFSSPSWSLKLHLTWVPMLLYTFLSNTMHRLWSSDCTPIFYWIKWYWKIVKLQKIVLRKIKERRNELKRQGRRNYLLNRNQDRRIQGSVACWWGQKAEGLWGREGSFSSWQWNRKHKGSITFLSAMMHFKWHIQRWHLRRMPGGSGIGEYKGAKGEDGKRAVQ